MESVCRRLCELEKTLARIESGIYNFLVEKGDCPKDPDIPPSPLILFKFPP